MFNSPPCCVARYCGNLGGAQIFLLGLRRTEGAMCAKLLPLGLVLFCWLHTGLHAFTLPPLPTPRYVLRPATLTHTLVMRVVPITKSQMLQIVPRKVTRPQLLAYWGLNPKERLQRILESVLISYGGTWLAWFVSFMAGSLVSAFLGTALIFNWLYSPWLNARNRNARMYPYRLNLRSATSKGGRSRSRSRRQSAAAVDPTPTRCYYAVFLGRISSLRKIKRRAGKTIGAVAQEYLVMQITDELGRDLEVITQWQGVYGALRVGMLAPCALASR